MDQPTPQQDNNLLSDFAVSQIRTIVPIVWGLVVTYLAKWFLLPDNLVQTAQGFSIVLTGIFIGCWYFVWRKLEPVLPSWVAALFLGSTRTPTYTQQ